MSDKSIVVGTKNQTEKEVKLEDKFNAIILSGSVDGFIVDGRKLNEFLGGKTKFKDWVKRIVKKFKLVENIDYISLAQKRAGNNATQIDYTFTSRVAQKISVKANTDVGDKLADYLYDLGQKQLAEVKPLSQLQMISAMATALHESNLELSKHDNRLSKLEERMIVEEDLPSALPRTTVPAKQRRADLNILIRNYASRTGDFRGAWNKLYKEIYYRAQVDVKIRAKNRNMAKLDYIESDIDLMETAYAIAYELFNIEE